MKFTGLTLAVAAFAAGAASQSLSGLPSCAQSCATSSIPSSCGIDVKCICSASSFITGVSCCIAKSCNQADQETTIQFADKICAGVGITNLPTSAVCSSTASATSGSQTSAASGSQTAAATGSQTTASGSQTSGTSTGSASAASATKTGAAAPIAMTNGGMAAGVMGAAMFAAMCLA